MDGIVFGAIKAIGFFLGLQGSSVKCCCFLCLADSRAKENDYKGKTNQLETNMFLVK